MSEANERRVSSVGLPVREAVSGDDPVLRTRYLYDAEFHAAVHTYAIRTRGGTAWVDEDGVRRKGPTLADARAVADLEARGLGLLYSPSPEASPLSQAMEHELAQASILFSRVPQGGARFDVGSRANGGNRTQGRRD